MAKQWIIGPVSVLPNGKYLTAKRTQFNRLRLWLAFRAYMLLLPEKKEELEIRTTSGVWY